MLRLHVLAAIITLTVASNRSSRQHRLLDRLIDRPGNTYIYETFDPSANVSFAAGSVWLRVVTEAPWSARAGGALHWNSALKSFMMHGIDIDDQDDAALEEVWTGSTSGKFSIVNQRIPFEPLYSAITTMDVNNVVYRIQGTDSERNSYSNVFRSTDNGNNWIDQSRNIKKNWPLPGTRYFGAAVALQSTPTAMLVFGGQDGTGELLNDIWHSTDSGINWRASHYPLAPFAPVAVNSALATQIEFHGGEYDAIYHIAGCTGTDPNDGAIYSNDIWLSVDLVQSIGNLWQKLPGPSPWAARGSAFVDITSTGVMIVAGGQGTGNKALNDIWTSLDGGYSWGLCASESEYSDRILAYVALDGDGYIWLMGGRDHSDGKHLNDIWRTTNSFQDVDDVARMCNMLIPSCGAGLKCMPNSPGFKSGMWGVICDECPNPPIAPPSGDKTTLSSGR